MQARVERAAQSSPSALVAEGLVDRESLASARATHDQRRAHCIGTQEELDWEVYRAYGLVDEDLTVPVGSEPEVRLGERAFEIVLARKASRGEADTVWFERHRSTPVTEVPDHWPAGLPRAGGATDRADRVRQAARARGATRLQAPVGLRPVGGPAGACLARVAARPARGAVLVEAGSRAPDPVRRPAGFPAGGRPAVPRGARDLGGAAVTDPAKELARLVADEHVPYLAALRYKPAGLRKRAEWEETWALQRREDAGEPVKVPVPPKYTSADFLKSSYWRHRGKLDVPKERFVSYPGAEKGADTSLVLGWAGWDHAEQAQALAGLLQDRQTREAWGPDRLTPILAGLAELEPWLHQWHSEPQPGAPQGPAAAVTGMLEQRLGQLGLTRDDLAGWRPAAPTRGRRPSG